VPLGAISSEGLKGDTMKWKSKKVGDERIRIIFALIPRDCTDGTTRWLEKVRVTEVLRAYKGFYWDEIKVQSLKKGLDHELQ